MHGAGYCMSAQLHQCGNITTVEEGGYCGKRYFQRLGVLSSEWHQESVE